LPVQRSTAQLGHAVVVDPDELRQLAARENATWCDLVCRLHRLAPQADTTMWWTSRRSPDLYPDAVTLDPAATEFDVLSRIDDGPGASVKDSFATLDLAPHGYTEIITGSWIARPPGVGEAPEDTVSFEVVKEKFPFLAWRRAWGGPEDSLPVALRRAAGVTIIGNPTPTGYESGAVLHHTRVGEVEVVGISNVFGPFEPVGAAGVARHRSAWFVGWQPGSDLGPAAALGFSAIGTMRVWQRAGPGVDTAPH
jgi:hypothetical protein